MAQSLILLESGRADRLDGVDHRGPTAEGRPPVTSKSSRSFLTHGPKGGSCVQGPRTAELSRQCHRGSGLVACGFGLCAKARARTPRRLRGPRIRLRAVGALLCVRRYAGALPSPRGGHRGGRLIGRGWPGLFESTFPFVGIAPSPAGRSIRAFRNPHSGAARGGAATAVVAGAPDGIPRLGAGRGRRPGDGFRPRGFGSPLSAGIASCWCRWLRHSP